MSNSVKISIELDKDSWHGKTIERMWAKKLDANLYQLDNIPIFAKGISYLDIFTVLNNKDDLILDSIVKKMGHRTYRVVFEEDVNSDIRNLCLEKLEQYASFEFHEEMDIYAFDIETIQDDENFILTLDKFESEKILDYEEGD